MSQSSVAAPFDLIFVSLEAWDEVWRRNQFLCALWARRHPDRKILFVVPPRILPLALKNRDLASLRPKLFNAPAFANIFVFRPLRLIPSTFTLTRRFNEWHERRQISAVARQVGLKNPLLWLNSHFARHMAGRMGEKGLIYDITDDWIAFDQGEALRKRIRAWDAALCHLADATIVCSPRLFDLKKALARRLEFIPNGVDASHYKTVAQEGELHPLAQNWNHPILGYTGSIHPERVDLKLVETLCREFPQGTVALVGPDMLTPMQREALLKHPNLVLTGPIPYSQLPTVMRAFDVCITPHLETDFTQSLNPLKLWEYLAVGKPIVATNVAGFRDFPAIVSVVSGGPDFVRACRTALHGDTLGQQRRAVARQNSWDARVDAVENLLCQIARVP